MSCRFSDIPRQLERLDTDAIAQVANPSHAKATVSVEDMESNAADVDATGAAATATAALAEGSGMPAGYLPALSSAEQLSQAPVLASGTANVGSTASGSNSVVFTFSPMTLAPEKSKDMGSARNNAAVASKPAVASAKTSDSDMMAVNKMVVAAVAAVAGLAVL